MILRRDGRLRPEDDYALLPDDVPLPAEGRWLVSWERWQQERIEADQAGRIALKIPNTLDVLAFGRQLLEHPLLVLQFPSFTDGRAYSQARLLRARLHYSGELRASGAAVVRDQIEGMKRCGFDSFELRADQDPERCMAALDEFSLYYQPACDAAAPVIRRRWPAAGPEPACPTR